MKNDPFLQAILDAVDDHIVVVDGQGEILFVNRSWCTFGDNNDCLLEGSWRGVNYLQHCDTAAEAGDSFGAVASKGIRGVIEGGRSQFYFEYPCHSDSQQRWFMMRIKPLEGMDQQYFVISHTNITERKAAEEEVLNLARIDGLTGIANRRTLDEFIHEEWRRCARQRQPISLLMIDLDHFKMLNDYYGHMLGDDCLQQVAGVLKRFTRRPSDIGARYGGEEFAVVYGNTSQQEALQMAEKIVAAITNLKIANDNSPVAPYLTLSIGIATFAPDSGDTTEAQLIKQADDNLYRAKNEGRNCIIC